MAEQRDRALPPPPLNRQPLGLLDFLQIKNGGQYPQRLVTDLVPTWDLRDHYLQVNAVLLEQTGIAIASGNNTYNVISAAVNYWRYCNYFRWSVVPANALDAYNGWPAIVAPVSLNAYMLPFEPCGTMETANYWIQPANATLRPVGGNTRDPFWVPPGYALALYQFNAVSTGGLSSIRALTSLTEFRS